MKRQTIWSNQSRSLRSSQRVTWFGGSRHIVQSPLEPHGSADIAKSHKDAAVAIIALDPKADDSSFYRNNSGGRARSLHLTSVENPFMEQVVTVPIAAQKQQEQ